MYSPEHEHEPRHEKSILENKSSLLIALLAAIVSIATAYITYWGGPVNVKKAEETAASAQKNANEARQIAEEVTLALNNSNQQIVQLQGATAGPIEQGQKLCRVLQSKQWRDGLIVPKNWNISLCRDYMLKSGGTRYQLGCIYPDGMNLGSEDGAIPTPNCGWQ